MHGNSNIKYKIHFVPLVKAGLNCNVRSQVVTILLLNIRAFCVTLCRWVSSSRSNHGGPRRNNKDNVITIFRNFGNYILKDSVTFQNKSLLQNSYPISLRFPSETQLWPIHYCLLSRAAELHNVVQRHFITNTSRLLRYGSISRTVSKTPSTFLLSDNQPADGTEDFHSRCLDSKSHVFPKPFSNLPYIYALDSPGSGSRKRQKIFLSAKTVQTSCEGHPAFNSMGAGVHSQGLQRTGHEVDHSPPASPRVKNECSCTLCVLKAWIRTNLL